MARKRPPQNKIADRKKRETSQRALSRQAQINIAPQNTVRDICAVTISIFKMGGGRSLLGICRGECVTDLSRYNPDNPCRPPCSVCSRPHPPAPPLGWGVAASLPLYSPATINRGHRRWAFRRRPPPLTRTDARTQTPPSVCPRFPHVCWCASLERPADGAVRDLRNALSTPPQQVPSLYAVDMNMYSVPNPGIPGCPPGLEYLTQVRQTAVCFHRNYN